MITGDILTTVSNQRFSVLNDRLYDHITHREFVPCDGNTISEEVYFGIGKKIKLTSPTLLEGMTPKALILNDPSLGYRKVIECAGHLLDGMYLLDFTFTDSNSLNKTVSLYFFNIQTGILTKKFTTLVSATSIYSNYDTIGPGYVDTENQFCCFFIANYLFIYDFDGNQILQRISSNSYNDLIQKRDITRIGEYIYTCAGWSNAAYVAKHLISGSTVTYESQTQVQLSTECVDVTCSQKTGIFSCYQYVNSMGNYSVYITLLKPVTLETWIVSYFSTSNVVDPFPITTSLITNLIDDDMYQISCTWKSGVGVNNNFQVMNLQRSWGAPPTAVLSETYGSSGHVGPVSFTMLDNIVVGINVYGGVYYSDHGLVNGMFLVIFNYEDIVPNMVAHSSFALSDPPGYGTKGVNKIASQGFTVCGTIENTTTTAPAIFYGADYLEIELPEYTLPTISQGYMATNNFGYMLVEWENQEANITPKDLQYLPKEFLDTEYNCIVGLTKEGAFIVGSHLSIYSAWYIKQNPLAGMDLTFNQKQALTKSRASVLIASDNGIIGLYDTETNMFIEASNSPLVDADGGFIGGLKNNISLFGGNNQIYRSNDNWETQLTQISLPAGDKFYMAVTQDDYTVYAIIQNTVDKVVRLNGSDDYFTMEDVYTNDVANTKITTIHIDSGLIIIGRDDGSVSYSYDFGNQWFNVTVAPTTDTIVSVYALSAGLVWVASDNNVYTLVTQFANSSKNHWIIENLPSNGGISDMFVMYNRVVIGSALSGIWVKELEI